ncbi:MAG: hypothetical protein Kow0031_01710 [Anaerolineae bacterium]
MATHPINPDEIVVARRNKWADNFFRPLLIITMIMCLNWAVVQLVWLVNPAWNGGFFLLAMLLTTLEAAYSFRLRRSFVGRGGSLLRFRLVEIGVLVLVLKLLLWVGKPWPAISAELQAIWQEPGMLLTTEFYVVLCLALSAWAVTTFTMADLDLLYDPYIDNRTTLDSLAERFFWGGGLLVVISGVTQWVARAGLSSLTDVQRPSLGGVVLNVLVYFVLGLVLLSQVNLTRLQLRWQVQKIAVSPGLVKVWARYGLLFLGVVMLVAFVLPTRYTLGLLATVGVALQFVIELFVFLLQLLLVLLTLPLVLLLSWLGFSPPDPAAMVRGGPPPLPPPSGAGPPAWLELAQSVLFWVVAVSAVVYLLKTYLDDRPELLAQLKQFRPVALLLRGLAWVWALLKRWWAAGRDALPAGLPVGGGGAKNGPNRPGGWRGWRRLSPRSRVVRYYLNVLTQAEKRGAPRRPHQTPYEYRPRLTGSAPEVEREIEELTEAFVHARYSPVPVDESEASAVQKWWQRIKQALRRHRH